MVIFFIDVNVLVGVWFDCLSVCWQSGSLSTNTLNIKTNIIYLFVTLFELKRRFFYLLKLQTNRVLHDYVIMKSSNRHFIYILMHSGMKL